MISILHLKRRRRRSRSLSGLGGMPERIMIVGGLVLAGAVIWYFKGKYPQIGAAGYRGYGLIVDPTSGNIVNATTPSEILPARGAAYLRTSGPQTAARGVLGTPRTARSVISGQRITLTTPPGIMRAY